MRVAKGATVFQVTDGDVELNTEWNDTTNCESGPNAAIGNNAAERVANINDGRLDMTIVFRPADGVYAALADGGNYAISFYPDKTLTASVISGTLAVERFHFMGRVRDAFKARVSGMFNGGRTAANL
jgi:hypothetical protein